MADHDHLGAGTRHRGRLLVTFVLVAAFFVVEVVVGLWANSLALLSDAGHMLTDVAGLGLALAALQLTARHERRRFTTGSPGRHTFGLYRLEILAAFVNSLLLMALAVYVLVEAIRRLGNEPEVLGTPMLVVGVLGLVVNLVGVVLLRSGADESLNLRGAYLEVLSDALGSVGVVVAAVALAVWDVTWVDPVVGAAIGLWILPRGAMLGARAVRILLQSAPPDVDLNRLRADLADLPDVVNVHDLHVWTLASGMEAATAHLMVPVGADHHGVLDQARDLLADRYGIAHATLQVEPEDHTGCAEVHW